MTFGKLTKKRTDSEKIQEALRTIEAMKKMLAKKEKNWEKLDLVKKDFYKGHEVFDVYGQLTGMWLDDIKSDLS